MEIEKRLHEIIRSQGVNLSEMARLTGVPYRALYDSLINASRKRDIRGWELVKVCRFLDVDPRDFADKETVGGR